VGLSSVLVCVRRLCPLRVPDLGLWSVQSKFCPKSQSVSGLVWVHPPCPAQFQSQFESEARFQVRSLCP
uniref:Uncharacterized protein n=1 Tax=Cannabis sativa TaxID=3483 RepID=A0A803QDG9_CANSA